MSCLKGYVILLVSTLTHNVIVTLDLTLWQSFHLDKHTVMTALPGLSEHESFEGLIIHLYDGVTKESLCSHICGDVK